MLLLLGSARTSHTLPAPASAPRNLRNPWVTTTDERRAPYDGESSVPLKSNLTLSFQAHFQSVFIEMSLLVNISAYFVHLLNMENAVEIS